MMERPSEKEERIEIKQPGYRQKMAVSEIAAIDQSQYADSFSHRSKAPRHLKSDYSSVGSPAQEVRTFGLHSLDFFDVAFRGFFDTGKRLRMAIKTARLQAIEGLIRRHGHRQFSHVEHVASDPMYAKERLPIAAFA
jgi:hypothetical protein